MIGWNSGRLGKESNNCKSIPVEKRLHLYSCGGAQTTWRRRLQLRPHRIKFSLLNLANDNSEFWYLRNASQWRSPVTCTLHVLSQQQELAFSDYSMFEPCPREAGKHRLKLLASTKC